MGILSKLKSGVKKFFSVSKRIQDPKPVRKLFSDAYTKYKTEIPFLKKAKKKAGPVGFLVPTTLRQIHVETTAGVITGGVFGKGGGKLAQKIVPKIAKGTGKTALGVLKKTAVPKSVGGLYGRIAGATLLATSPTIRKATLDVLNPKTTIKTAKGLGKKIESFSPETKDIIGKITGKAGIFGVGAALGAAAGWGIPKLISWVKGGRQDSTSSVVSSGIPAPINVYPSATPMVPTMEALQPYKDIEAEEKKALEEEEKEFKKKMASPKPMKVSQNVNLKVTAGNRTFKNTQFLIAQ